MQPEWCENVEGHLSLGAASVFRDLSGLGYGVKAGLFSAAEVGASHQRRRLFIVAHADKVPLLQQDQSGVCERDLSDAGRSDADRQPVSDRESSTAVDPHLVTDQSVRGAADEAIQLPVFALPPSEFAGWAEILDQRPDLQPELFGLADGLADRVDRSDAAGNGVVSLAAAYAWRTLKAAHLNA